MTVLATTDRAAWLDWRRGGIGASDMPAILGVSPFKTPLDVYLEKTGQTTPEPPSLQQRIGLALESGVLRLYEEETGREVVETQVQVTHKGMAFLRATLDATATDGRGTRPVEVKTVAGDRARELGEAGTDELPGHWLVQVHHQMLVMGERCEVVDVAALLRGQDFRVYTVERDPELIEMIVEEGLRFWANLKNGIAPEPSLPADARHLPRVFGAGEGVCELDEEIARYVESYEEAAHVARLGSQADVNKKRIASHIVAALGEHASGRLPDGRIVHRKLIDVKADPCPKPRDGYSYYRLSIK